MNAQMVDITLMWQDSQYNIFSFSMTAGRKFEMATYFGPSVTNIYVWTDGMSVMQAPLVNGGYENILPRPNVDINTNIFTFELSSRSEYNMTTFYNSSPTLSTCVAYF